MGPLFYPVSLHPLLIKLYFPVLLPQDYLEGVGRPWEGQSQRKTADPDYKVTRAVQWQLEGRMDSITCFKILSIILVLDSRKKGSFLQYVL
jgi:hypothetical protein